MQAAGDLTARRAPGRLQTVVVTLLAGTAIAVAAWFASGGSGDGFTEVSLDVDTSVPAPAVGAVPAAFSGTTYDGTAVALSDFAGRPTWLTFGASWCVDCRAEAADLEATYEANRAKGLAILGVFIRESASEVSDYARRAGITFPIVVDPNARIAAAYRLIGLPLHLFIGRDGRIREIRFGRLTREEMERSVAAVLR